MLLLTGAALGDRFGRRRMFVVGLALLTAASAAAVLAPTTGALIAARAVQGVGAAVVTPLTLTLLADAFPVGSAAWRSARGRASPAGQASGATNAVRALGGVLGIAVLATVFASNGSYESPQAYTDGMTSAVWVGAAALAAGALAALFVPGRRRTEKASIGAPVPAAG